MMMCEMLDIQAKNYIFKTYEDCWDCVRSAMADGAVVGIGGAYIKAGNVQPGEGKMMTVTHHVLVHEMREDGGVYAITRRSRKIHVQDVEHEQSHEKLFKTGYGLV